MISFKQSLEINKTVKLAEQCFYLMESHGISSVNFVDWIEQNYNQDLQENVKLWLKTEVNFLENYNSEYFQEEDITLAQSWQQDKDAMKQAWNKFANSDFMDMSKSPTLQGAKKLAQGAKNLAGNVAQGAKNLAGNVAQGAKNLAGSVVQGAAGAYQKFANYRDISSMTKNVDLAKQKLYDLIKKGERENSVLKNNDVQAAIMALHKELQKLDKSTIARISQEFPQNSSMSDYSKLDNAEQELTSLLSNKSPKSYSNIKSPESYSNSNIKSSKAYSNSNIKSPEVYTNSYPEHVSIEDKLLETRIKSVCYKLNDLHINPHHFATCFVEEFCDDHNIIESSWLGGAWSGLKGAVKGGWERLMGGGEGSFWDAVQKGYTSGRDTKYDEYDRQAIQDAINHLSAFAKQIKGSTIQQNFTNRIINVIGNLNKALSFKPTQVQQSQLEQEPNQANADKKDNLNIIGSTSDVDPEQADDMLKKSGKEATPPTEKTDYEKQQDYLKSLMSPDALSAEKDKESANNAEKAITDKQKIKAADDYFKRKTTNDERKAIGEKWPNLNSEMKLKIIDSDDYKNIIQQYTTGKIKTQDLKKAYERLLDVIKKHESDIAAKSSIPATTNVPPSAVGTAAK